MLDIIRNLVGSIFGKILLCIMVLSFALWGVGDLLNSGNSQLAAKVSNQKITLNDFYYEFQRSIDQFNNNLEKKISQAEAYEKNIHSLVINEMVYDQMINVYSNNNNFFINNEILKNVIKSMSQFQNDDGSFNKTFYEYSIQNNFPSEKKFLDDVKMIYIKGHLFDLFNSDISLNKNIHKFILDYETETRNFEYFTINNIPFKSPALKEIDLLDYYEENKNEFRVSKEIIIDLIEVNYKDFADEINIDQSLIENNYKNNLSSYTTPETRNINFARFNNFDDAEKYRSILLNASDLEIKKYDKANNIVFNNILDLEFTDFNATLSKNIFNLSNGEISNVIDTNQLGFYIVKINSIVNEKVVSLNEVSDEIKEKLVQDEAYDIFDEAVNLVDEYSSSGYSLNEISEKININIIKGVNFKEISTSILDTEFLLKTNDEDVGFQSDVYLENDRALIIKIVEIIDEYIPAYKAVEKDVQTKLSNLKKNQFLDEMLSTIALEIKPDGSEGFYRYAYANSAKLEKINLVKRSIPIKDIDAETQKALFKIEKDNILIFKNDGVYGILLLTEINDKNEDQEFINKIRDNINNNYNSSISKILENEIINNTEYQIFNQNIDNIF